MCGVGDEFPPSVSRAQHDSQRSIYKQLGRFKGSSKPCTVQEAVKELLRASATYDGEETSNTVRAYDRDLVSLPDCGDEPVSLSQVLDAHGRELVKDPLAYMLKDSEEWGAMVEHGETFQPYMDPQLQANGELYAIFVKDLVDKGMLDFIMRLGDLVTPFFVVKKSGKLRFILDCRGVNKRFRDPPPLTLAAGSTWAQLEVKPDKKLYVAQLDIRDYFFSLALPEDLKPLFCMPPISVQWLHEWGIEVPRDGVVDSGGWVWPRCRVIPMGWSWAMYIAQRVRQHLCLEAAQLDTSRLLVEGRPAPDLSSDEVAIIPYADNLNVAGTDQIRVQQVKDAIVARLRHHGFRVHEETEASTLAQSLGFLVDGEQLCITPIPERWTKVLQAFGWLASRPGVSGKAVERLLGHAVHFAMLRRELLLIFCSLYDFVARSYNKRQRLWASAAKEAKGAQHLFKLCSVDIKRSWSSNMSASDASLSGVAICSRELSVSEVARHGRVRETWRYVTGNPVKPREIALQHGDPFSDPNTVKPLTQQRSDPYELNFDFPEIEKEIMQQDSWSNDFAIHTQHPEHITLLEGRSVVAAMRHKLRSSSQFGFKHLRVTDNMSVVLLCSKGRSSTFGMLRVCRRLACLLLATDSFLQVRWVPSELNVADKASRQWEHLRQHVVSARPGPKAQEFGTSTTWNSAACASRRPQAKQDQESWKEVEPHQRGKTAGEKPDKAATQRSCQIQGTNIPGEDGSVTACGGGLSQANARLLSVPESPQDQQDMLEEQHDEVRRGLQLLHESHVRSRLRACRRNKIPSSRVRHVPRLWAQAHISPRETFTAGLAVIAAVVMRMLTQGHCQAAAAVLLCFTAYLRPGEMLGLRRTDLVRPMPTQRHWSLLLHPAERQSKVGRADDNILLDAPLIPWLGEALSKLQSPDIFLINLTYFELVQIWRKTLKEVGLPQDHAVLYRLRQSGPSHDRFYKLRPLAEVKQRGRWIADTTVRRYESHARLNQEFNELPKTVQQTAQIAAKDFSLRAPRFFGLRQTVKSDFLHPCL